MNRFREATAWLGADPGRIAALRRLTTPVSLHALADRGVSDRLLHDLEDYGLAERVFDPATRSFHVVASAAGTRALGQP